MPRTRPRRWPSPPAGLAKREILAPGAAGLQGKPEARRESRAARDLRDSCASSAASASPTTRWTPTRRRRASASRLSEPVSRTVTDFTPYFRQEPGPVAAVTAEGTQALRRGPRTWRALHDHRPRRAFPPPSMTACRRTASFEFYVRTATRRCASPAAATCCRASARTAFR